MDNIENKNDDLNQTTAAQKEIVADSSDVKKARAKNVRNAQNVILSYLHDLVYLLVALLLLFVLLFRIVVVSGESMLGTLHEGDYLVVLSSSVYRNPEPGDIVVVSKDSYKGGEPLVKRVIAVGGQTIDIRENTVYVDGEAQHIGGNAKDAITHAGHYEDKAYSYPLEVPEGYIFVLGDNRENSTDSRSKKIGMIDEREVLGKVLFVALPAEDPATDKRDFSRFGAV